MRESGTTPTLEVDGIDWVYGDRTALDDVSFSIKPGETVMLLGPNGAGKTTLFSLICGLFAPRTGSIRIMGRDVARGSGALAPLGIVFQHPALDLDLTVGQNLRYFCSLHGIDPTEAATRIDDELSRLDLADRINDKVRSLNGGHRRRVEIARAALHRPGLLLLDEPTVGLDIPTRRALVDDLRTRPNRDGVSILWATHLIDEIEGADRVVVLHKGRIVADASPQKLLEITGTSSLDAAFAALTREAKAA